MARSFLLLFLLLVAFSSCQAISVGQPTIRPQFVTVQGTQIKAADVEVPLSFDENETNDLFVLSEGFVCPAQSSSMSCLATPSCVCDYSSLSSPASCQLELPSCCQTANPDLWASACSDSDAPSEWLVLEPNLTLNVTAPPIRGSVVNKPIYLRYHPSSSSSCRGFGLSVLAPFEELSDVVSLSSTIVYYVSWTNARPETDPYASKLAARPAQSDRTGRPRFCPSYDGDSDQTNGFFGASNSGTAFIAVFSETSDLDLNNVPAYVTFTLYETPEVRGITAVVPSATPIGATALTDKITVVVPAGQTSSTFTYTHEVNTNSACANVIIDAHANGESATTAMSGDYAPSYIRWLTAGFSSATSITVNICPGQTLYVSVTTSAATNVQSPAATTTLVTAYVNPTVALLDINALNPNLFGPLLTGVRASRLLCNNNNLPSQAIGYPGLIFTNPDKKYVSPCYGGYVDSNTPSCLLYPFPNREGATMLWPAAPSGILATNSYAQFLARELSSGIGKVVSPNLRFSAILEQQYFQSSYYGSIAGWIFRSWQELSECTIEFSGTLLSSSGARLYGITNAFGVVDQSACNASTYSVDQENLASSSQIFKDPLFLREEVAVQRTALLREAQSALLGEFSQCAYIPQEVYMTPYSQQVNCSTSDPCCPLSDQFVRYFYGYCTADVYVRTNPTVHPEEIAIDGGNYQCTTALTYETSTSQLLITPAASAFNSVPCSFGQDSIDHLQKELTSYYQYCRTSIVGRFDEGVPCATVDDCPVHPNMACLPVANENVFNSAQSADYRRRKMCQAPSAVFDELLLQCLVDFMPVLVEYSFSQVFEYANLNGDFADNLRAYLERPACAATAPSLFQQHAPTTQLRLDSFNAAGQTFNSCYNSGTCPYPVNCVDSSCELSQGCTYPWGCSASFVSFTDGTDEETCDASFQCNYVPVNGVAPTSCTGSNLQSCQAVCEAELGGATGFCGFCDERTGFCYVAADAAGTPLSESQCESATSGCFIQDLGSLVATPCNGAGTCTHFSDAGESFDVVTEAECMSAPGLCLTQEGSIMFPRTAGCIGATQIAGLGCSNQPAQLTDSGCLYSLSAFASADECEGAIDPMVPTQSVKGWVNVIDSEEECLNNEALFVCTVDYFDSAPFASTPNLNSKSVCASRGGTFASPYRWEPPTFIAGEAVTLSWMSVQAVSSAEWTTRVSYPEFSSVLKTIINALQVNSDILTASCTYTNVLSTAALAAACQDVMYEAEFRDACRTISDVTNGQAPLQNLGEITICDNVYIDDYVEYPSQLNIPPVQLALFNTSRMHSNDFDIMPGCVQIDADMRSNSKFSQPRRRIRETSFFIARQDVDIPSLSTLSTDLVANGYILSDAVRLQAHSTQMLGPWMCIQTRADFLADVSKLYSTSNVSWSSFSLGFGVLNDWAVTPFASTDSDGVRSSFLSENGSFSGYIGGRRFPEGQSLRELTSVCRRFDELELDPGEAAFYVAVITFHADPEDVPNGFNTVETVWLYITACLYLVPVLFLWLPLVIRSLLAKQSLLGVPMIATFFLSMFLVFRAALLFGLAAGTIASSSTTEFALTDVAVWCEFAAICLLGLVITVAMTSSNKMQTSKGFFSSRSQQLVFYFLIVFLLAVFVAFVIAYSQTGNSSSGVTNPRTDCVGRMPDGVTMWTPRRILRLSYECLLATMGLVIGLWLISLGLSISKKAKTSGSGTQLFRLTLSTAMLAIMILSHAIIALILIGTEWNNFIFGIIMLYVTELLPLFAFFVLSLWKNITAFTSLSFSFTRTTGSQSRRSASPGGNSSNISKNSRESRSSI